MENVAKEKICENCNKPYAPTSSAQKWCPECARLAKNTRDRAYRKKKKTIQKQQPVKKISSDGNSGILQKLIEQRDRLNVAIEVIEKL